MKHVLFCFLMFAPAVVYAQKCDSGKIWVPEMGTSGCIIKSGCYTKEEAKRLCDFIGKCACEETSSSFSMGDDSGNWTGYGEDHKWYNGDCDITYWVNNGKNKIILTEEQYDSVRISHGWSIEKWIGNKRIRRTKSGVDTTQF
jgi:hypothetical protein